MIDYSIKLYGPDLQHVPLSGSLLASLFESLDKGTKGAVRLKLDGQSFAKGTQPGWLSRASFFRLESIEPEVSVLRLAAPRLEESVAASAPQYDLIPEADMHKTGLTLLAEGLRDAIGAVPEADTYDAGLLNSFQVFKGVFNSGVVGVELRNSNPLTPTIELGPEALKSFKSLRPRKVEPQYATVAGKLDMIRDSDRAFELQIAAGVSVRGVFADAMPYPLSEFFGKKVVVSGLALFRPSGSLLRLDASTVDFANDADIALWNTIPKPMDDYPLFQRASRLMLTKGAEVASQVAQAHGTWPRPVSRDDIRAAHTVLLRNR